MSDNIFQTVFDEIQDYLPDGWRNLVLFVAYTEGSYSMKFYYSVEQNHYADCYSIPGVTPVQLIQTFANLDKLFSKERNELLKEKKWTVMTITVESNGTFKTEYDYTDVSGNMIAYQRDWERKYLG